MAFLLLAIAVAIAVVALLVLLFRQPRLSGILFLAAVVVMFYAAGSHGTDKVQAIIAFFIALVLMVPGLSLVFENSQKTAAMCRA